MTVTNPSTVSAGKIVELLFIVGKNYGLAFLAGGQLDGGVEVLNVNDVPINFQSPKGFSGPLVILISNPSDEEPEPIRVEPIFNVIPEAYAKPSTGAAHCGKGPIYGKHIGPELFDHLYIGTIDPFQVFWNFNGDMIPLVKGQGKRLAGFN